MDQKTLITIGLAVLGVVALANFGPTKNLLGGVDTSRADFWSRKR